MGQRHGMGAKGRETEMAKGCVSGTLKDRRSPAGQRNSLCESCVTLGDGVTEQE